MHYPMHFHVLLLNEVLYFPRQEFLEKSFHHLHLQPTISDRRNYTFEMKRILFKYRDEISNLHFTRLGINDFDSIEIPSRTRSGIIVSNFDFTQSTHGYAFDIENIFLETLFCHQLIFENNQHTLFCSNLLALFDFFNSRSPKPYKQQFLFHSSSSNSLPESSCSPQMVKNTLASVPAPLLFPVKT